MIRLVRLPRPVITYFAYGSNMLTERIKARARDANPLGIAHIAGRRLTFHKIATRKDGSRTGKCDICIDTDPKAIVYGVLFEIPESQFDDLNTFEQGYSLVELVVHSFRLGPLLPLRISGIELTPTLIPYDWYRDLVLEGALQHAIPKAYIRDYIQSVRVEEIRFDIQRCQRSQSIGGTYSQCTQRSADHRGVDLNSDALPFGGLWYGEPDAISNAIDYAKFRSRSQTL